MAETAYMGCTSILGAVVRIGGFHIIDAQIKQHIIKKKELPTIDIPGDDGGSYEEAEKKLEEALTAAEAVSGARHPRVGLVLLAIARVYARTRRISFAEGLYK